MLGKSLFKKVISLIVMTAVLASCAACGNVAIKTQKLGTETDDIPKATREEAFREIVQSTVNKYGILDEDDAEKSFEIENVNGLWEAKTIDITGDDKDELFLVYLDNSKINMQVYEYKNGSATREWNEKTDWGGVFDLNVYKDNNAAHWLYSASRHYPGDVVGYVNGNYKSAFSLGGFTDDENDYIYSAADGMSGEGNRMYEVLKNRLDIEGDDVYGSDNHLMSLHCEGMINNAAAEDLKSRWDLNIPEPRVSPTEALSSIQYYGDIEKCKMTKEMALAYAEAIENEKKYAKPGKWFDNVSVYAILMDLAGDGMPLLLTVLADGTIEGNNVEYYQDRESLGVWTWNGHDAVRYDFKADCDEEFVFGYNFFPNGGETMISVDDGVGLDAGSCEGQLNYTVSNATIKLTSHIMDYSAFADYDDSSLARGSKLPGISSAKKTEVGYCAPAEDLLNAGWVTPYNTSEEYSIFYARFIDGQMVKFSDYNEYQEHLDNYWQEISIKDKYEVYGATTGGDGIVTSDWSTSDSVINALNTYSKVAGKPFYNYEEVSGTLTDKQVKAIAKKAAEKVKGEVGEIYKLSDDLYLVIIYVDGEVSGSVILKNTESGKNWRIIKLDKKAMTEDVVADEVNKDSKTSNIKIDLGKANEGTVYLEDVLESIDGSKPNDTAKEQIADFIETAVSQSSRVNVKAKGNKVSINKKDISKATEAAKNTSSEYAKLLKDKGISLNKSTTIIIYVIVENVENGKAMQVTFDKEMVNALSDGNEVMLILGDSSCSIKATKADLKAILKKHGKLTVTLKKSKDNSYEIQFADKDGELIEKLQNSITFALPADDELCTIEAQYTGGTDNWGGQFDSAQKTLSFATPYSGTYTVLSEKINITDIANLSEEHQKAIQFMVSKGYFNLENGSFDPYGSLNRYAFSEALVRMFFALDRDAKASFSDITEDDPYYPYVASGENANIIEGYEDGTFRGLNDVLIEEVLALCSRTLKEYKGYVEPEDPFDYLHFADNDMISGWAQSEIALTVRDGLIDDGGMLHPQSTISRAESALLLYRLFMLLYEVEPVAVIADSSLGSADTMILILGGAMGVLIIVIGVLVVILLKKRSKASTVQDTANENSAEPDTDGETATDTEAEDR